ncbi:unnamed protein product [Chrysodeixis includens]|uniref:Uncharacterized protein n=1 Tax=Chrysodeixis includens TaxID=689277 RepID=A0A9N8KPY6_CHRIL|nr:unnamed protein product [Chrysodeixis includens]
MAKSKTGLFALGFFVFAALFIIIAFVSPYWLVTDGKLKNPKFLKIGLWEVCFNGFEEIHHWYDTVFSGCWWIFEEEYYIIHDILLPGFFIATQFFFTISMCCVILSLFLSYLYMKKDRDDDKYLTLLVTLGTVLVIGGFSGIISVVTFGARGDGRDWMPNWEHNDLGWAFAMGVIGVVFLFPADGLRVTNVSLYGSRRGHGVAGVTADLLLPIVVAKMVSDSVVVLKAPSCETVISRKEVTKRNHEILTAAPRIHRRRDCLRPPYLGVGRQSDEYLPHIDINRYPKQRIATSVSRARSGSKR